MPTPDDVLLLVEIADSSLDYDRNTKVPLYSEAGIVEYWLVNLVDNVILVYRDPGPTGYAVVQVLRRGDTIRPVAFPDVEIAISDVLWP
jgi:Uma2 family endonuclease